MSIDGGLSVWPFVAVTLIRIGCVIVLYFCCNFAAISFSYILLFFNVYSFFSIVIFDLYSDLQSFLNLKKIEII